MEELSSQEKLEPLGVGGKGEKTPDGSPQATSHCP